MRTPSAVKIALSGGWRSAGSSHPDPGPIRTEGAEPTARTRERARNGRLANRSRTRGLPPRGNRRKRPSTFVTLRRTATEFSEDNLTDWAAALTYYGLLSPVPGADRLRGDRRPVRRSQGATQADHRRRLRDRAVLGEPTPSRGRSSRSPRTRAAGIMCDRRDPGRAVVRVELTSGRSCARRT